ncbi:MAG: hypothetical protein QOG50_1489 [Actinomycetota bacterium]|nr:hypothetical protein [Actinomycetota bacterium]
MNADIGDEWGEDPGWRLRSSSLMLLIPYVARFYLRRAGGDPLVNLRSVYLSFPGGLLFLGLVIPFVVAFRGDRATLPWALALVAIAVVDSVLPRMFERPMPCDSLAGYFRTRMFLRLAFANSIALFGFVFAFTAMSGWLYYFGLALSVPGLVRAAPTRAALIREQDELTARGCNRSLVSALRSTPPK